MYEDCAPQEEQVEKAVDCTASNGVRVQEGWRCTHKCINRLEGIIGRKRKKKRKKIIYIYLKSIFPTNANHHTLCSNTDARWNGSNSTLKTRPVIYYLKPTYCCPFQYFPIPWLWWWWWCVTSLVGISTVAYVRIGKKTDLNLGSRSKYSRASGVLIWEQKKKKIRYKIIYLHYTSWEHKDGSKDWPHVVDFDRNSAEHGECSYIPRFVHPTLVVVLVLAHDAALPLQILVF